MQCLFCGKEIGAFRRLKDREFCSVEHRKKYGDRLGKTLHQLAAPQPPPADVAGFVLKMPLQSGTTQRRLAPWTQPSSLWAQTYSQWPFAIDALQGARPHRLAAVCQTMTAPAPSSGSGWNHSLRLPAFPLAVLASAETTPEAPPPQCVKWMRSPEPGPVFSFVQPAAALATFAASPAMQTPRFAAELEPVPSHGQPPIPAAYRLWMRAPEPEPAWAFVQSAAALASLAVAPAELQLPRFAAELEPLAILDQPMPPAACQGWMRAPEPEPVWAFVQPAASLAPLAVTPAALRFAAELEPLPILDQPMLPAAACQGWMRAPEPEPVWAFVQPAAALSSLAVAPTALQLPRFAAELDPLPILDQPMPPAAACQGWMHAPEPEPVWAFVQPAAALASLAVAPATLQLPRFAAELDPLPIFDQPMPPPAACQGWMRAPEPEPVWAFVQPAAALASLAVAPAALRFAAELQPLPILDQPMPPPAECQGWMRVPEPEPVFSFLRTAAAGAVAASIATRAPEMAALKIAGPHIPSAARFQAGPQAEPAMAGVWPHVADIPFEPICNPTSMRLPGIGALGQDDAPLQVPAAQTAVASAAAEPVESLLFASQAAIPLPAATADCALPQVAASALGAVTGGPQIARPAAGMAPDALESLLAASTADQIKSATVVRLQPFAVAASEERNLPGFDAPRLAPPVSQPEAAAAKVVVLPIPTIRVAAPQPAPHRPTPSIPQPGLMTLEFHAQRVRGEAVTRLEWRGVRFAPLPPRFSLRPVWDRTEDLVAYKPAAPKSTMADVFAMPEAKPKSSKWVGYAIKIAAGIVIVMATWYGAGSIQMDRSLQVRTDVSTPAVNMPSGTATGSRSTVARAGKTEATGPVARFRQTIARRAAAQYGDNLREGMQAWGAAPKSYPSGWLRSPEGYVSTGALALFSPTLKFTDYRLEFFGQIEDKSMGWTVRSKDSKNYHAMKFTVIEAGLRPVIAMVHYNVVNGKAGLKVQTPLNVMVHNHKPFQVAVNVKGSRFVTSIDGEEVDSYSDDALASGGVGFFSEAGERARLYWVRVSKNDDWLGHICAFLAGVDSAPATAEIWPGELPSTPAPWNPGGDRASLAGAWIALPYISASRRARFVKSLRYQKWNT